MIDKSIICLFADYSHYYDDLVCLLEQLQPLIPAAKVQICALIDSMKCQKDSIMCEDKSKVLKCLTALVPKSVAGMMIYTRSQHECQLIPLLMLNLFHSSGTKNFNPSKTAAPPKLCQCFNCEKRNNYFTRCGLHLCGQQSVQKHSINIATICE